MLLLSLYNGKHIQYRFLPDLPYSLNIVYYFLLQIYRDSSGDLFVTINKDYFLPPVQMTEVKRNTTISSRIL